MFLPVICHTSKKVIIIDSILRVSFSLGHLTFLMGTTRRSKKIELYFPSPFFAIYLNAYIKRYWQTTKNELLLHSLPV